MFKANNISKSFGAVRALQDASISLAPGEIRALIGANGSGKSTFAKILGGTVVKDSGEIFIKGKKVKINSSLDSRRSGIAVAYQDISLIPFLTVEENLTLGKEPRTPRGLIDKKKQRDIALRIIERYELDVRPEDLVASLDIDKQSLLEVAKAILSNPDILILDEVTASLHYEQVELLFDILNNLKKEGIIILFISHRLQEVFSFCDTATVLREGKSIKTLSLEKTDESELVYYMTGKRPEKGLLSRGEINKTDDNLIFRVSNLRTANRLKNISLDVYQGEIVGISGLQGQGQSEFLKAVFGLQEIAKGLIEFEGEPVRMKSPQDALRNGIGYITGDRSKGILHSRSVAQNILLTKIVCSGYFSLANPNFIKKTAREMVDQLNVVAENVTDEAERLSGGNQQKLVIGRWLIANPKLLLLDDPTKGVDVGARHEIHLLLHKMTEAGTTIIISSSDNEELIEIADRIYVFYEGNVKAELSNRENQNIEEKIISAMLGINESEKGVVLDG